MYLLIFVFVMQALLVRSFFYSSGISLDRYAHALPVVSTIMRSTYVRKRRMSKRNTAQNTGQKINEPPDWRQQLKADSSIHC